METPQRPVSHTLGDIGQKFVKLEITRWGWTADSVKSNYGEDVDCTIYVDGNRTNLMFRCQVKATEKGTSSVRRLVSGDYSVQISSGLTKIWLLSYFPVLLIVYDETLRKAFWTNASEQLQDKLPKFNKRNITITVNASSDLRLSEQAIISSVQDFYAGFLKIFSPVLACEVYPVTMPAYASVPRQQFRDCFPVCEKMGEFEFENDISYLDMNLAPSWLNSIKILESEFLIGWRLRKRNCDLGCFWNFTKNFVGKVEKEIERESHQWLAFIVSPIHFAVEEDDGKTDFWNKKITGWFALNRLSTEVTTDQEHAFRPPPGFLRQVARKATSWEGYHFVNPCKDLAIQLFGVTRTTFAYKRLHENFRQYMKGQFIPWICNKDDVQLINKLLESTDFTFRYFEQEIANDGLVHGIVCHRMFNPELGLLIVPRDWNEFHDGIRSRLVAFGILENLPGREGHGEITKAILEMGFNEHTDEQQVFVTEKDYVFGLPKCLDKMDHFYASVLAFSGSLLS